MLGSREHTLYCLEGSITDFVMKEHKSKSHSFWFPAEVGGNGNGGKGYCYRSPLILVIGIEADITHKKSGITRILKGWLSVQMRKMNVLRHRELHYDHTKYQQKQTRHNYQK